MTRDVGRGPRGRESGGSCRSDAVLVVLVVLLVLTLGAYAAGWTAYPFGVIVLLALIAMRVSRSRRR